MNMQDLSAGLVSVLLTDNLLWAFHHCREGGFRIVFPIRIPCSCPRMVFSASLSLSCVRRTGGQAMWEMKRSPPSGERELDLDQLWVRRTCVLCTPNHLSFKGMFMFAHFSPSIVLEEAELLRALMCWVTEMQAQSQIPTFHTHVLGPDSGEKAPASDSNQSAVSQCFLRVCGKTEMLQCVIVMGVVAASQCCQDWDVKGKQITQRSFWSSWNNCSVL